jgi:peptidyl-prolyl cis-trans isomerase-like 4
VIDLHTKRAPNTCRNFLKLCKIKYYNFSAFTSVQKDFTAQTGDPFNNGGSSIDGLLYGAARRYIPAEIHPKLRHERVGTVSMAVADTGGLNVTGSQFFITLKGGLDYLDGKYTVFGQVAEGLDVLDKINMAYVDDKHRPYRDIRIKHTIVLDDPFDDPEGLEVPGESPLPTAAQLATVRIDADAELEPDMPPEEMERVARQKEAAAQALTLEMIGDIPFAEIKPPENVLFVCKLNPVTRDDDLELIFSRFGAIVSCEVIRDKKTGDSLQYAFVEFDKREDAEEAYFKMDNVLIDDRRIHVDFSQSVSKLHHNWVVGRQKKMQPGEQFVARKRYRDHVDKQDNYEMVFEHEDGRQAKHQRQDHRLEDYRDRRTDHRDKRDDHQRRDCSDRRDDQYRH